jgi:hypothetical protein
MCCATESRGPQRVLLNMKYESRKWMAVIRILSPKISVQHKYDEACLGTDIGGVIWGSRREQIHSLGKLLVRLAADHRARHGDIYGFTT